MSNTNEKTCKDRVSKEYAERMKDLRKLFKTYQEGNEEKYADDLGTFFDYGLCFDYVPQGTFNDQTEAFFRYQLSWGGPGDEFRFFVNPDFSVHRIEYWFLDWYDGAHKVLKGKGYIFMEEIFDFFKEIGTVQAEYNKAKE